MAVDRAAAQSGRMDHHDGSHAIRAELLSRLGRKVEAEAAFDQAIALAENATERAFLQRKRDSLAPLAASER